MDSAEQKFLRGWDERFPGLEAPHLGCFTEGSLSSVKQAYSECQHRISSLKSKIKQEEFVLHFLRNLHHSCINFDGRTSRVYSLSDDRTDEEKLELDSPVPILDLDPHDQHKEGLYKSPGSNSGEHRGHDSSFWQQANESDPSNRVSRHGSVHTNHTDRESSTTKLESEKGEGKISEGPNTRGQTSGKVTGLGAQGVSRPDNSRFSNVEKLSKIFKEPLAKTVSEPSNNFIGDRNTAERLSQRNRPPVPLPRPSVRGPVFKSSQGSPGSERKFPTGASDVPPSPSTPVENVFPQSHQDMAELRSPNALRRARRVNEYCEIDVTSIGSRESIDSGGSADDVRGQRDRGSNEELPNSKRKQRQKQNRQREYVNVSINPVTGSPATSPAVMPKPMGPPLLKRRDKDVAINNTDSGSSASICSKEEDDDALIFDNRVSPSPGDDESSSDDDEPIYFNLMMLKKEYVQNTSLDTSAIYASVDLEQKEIERQKRRLSKGSLPSPLSRDTSLGPPVPQKPPPTLKAKTKLKATNSTDSTDSVFDEDDVGVSRGERWKKRGSMRAATEEDVRSVSSNEGLEVPTVGSGESEKSRMRKWVVTGILDSAHSYVDMLDVLLQYMKSLEAASKSSQPLISAEDIKTIFSNIPDLHRIHSRFIQGLEPIVEHWSPDTHVAHIFKLLAVEEYPVASEYLQNYQKGLACLQRCAEETQQFAKLVEEIKFKGQKESLEEMLHKPVVRVQRNTLVLHDLIKLTPTSHNDYDMLQKTLKITQNFLESFQAPTDPDNTEHHRYLVKNGMIVEMCNNRRKLRQIFLFNDVLVCAKQKLHRQRLLFEIKWMIPLSDILIEASQSKEDSRIAAMQREKVERLKKRVSELQIEMRTEVRKQQGHGDGRNWSIRGGNKLEKIRKKFSEQEVELLRESPHLVFRLRTKNKKSKPITLLMSSDYERTDWRENITGLQIKNTRATTSAELNAVEIQNLINSIQRAKINAFGGMEDDFAMEEEQVFGCLGVVVMGVQGLKEKCDTFCCIEVDAYGQSFMKAKTNIICGSYEPKWNEEFEIDLEGSQTLRLLLYKMQGDSDVLLGRGAFELSKAWLKSSFQENTVSLNEELSLTIKLRYSSREQTLKRTPSSVKGGLFGVKISSVTKRESRQVPLIISTCVEEVERRGLDDVGIYRISGLSSEIQRLKKAFERNAKGAIPLARETDCHVIACLLKLYFRELPEALFTDKLYPNLIEGMNMSDPDAKQRCMMSLLRSLPEPNYTCVIYMIDHMLRVSDSSDVNKMTINNLATVFGPTLLRPAVTDEQPVTMDLFSAGARDALMQTGILHYFLTLKSAGVSFSKHQ